jgi:hypothetical protein
MGWADQGRELYLGQEKATAGLVGGPRSKATLIIKGLPSA